MAESGFIPSTGVSSMPAAIPNIGALRQDHFELLRALPTAIYATDELGRITFCNPAAAEFAGREPVLGSDRWCISWRLYYVDGRPMPHEECPLAISLKERRPLREAEAILERPDGRRIVFATFPTPIFDASGELSGAVNMMVDITERKRTEQAVLQVNETLEKRIENRTRRAKEVLAQLRDANYRFRLLVQSVTDYAIYMLDRNGIVTNWNAGAERIKGYRTGEVIGQHFSLFYTPEDRARGLPQAALAKAEREGRYESEGWRVRKDGTRFWASAVIDVIRDESGEIAGFAKVTRDVTERMHAQEALAESERVARGIVETALDGVVQLDDNGRIVEWNRQAAALFGWSREEALGQRLDSLIFPATEGGDAADGFAALLRRDEVGSILGKHVALPARRRDGTEITVELAFTAFPLGKRVVYNGFIRDITERLAMEAQLRHAQKLDAIGQLTGGVAHDFNNLLTVLAGNLDLLRHWARTENAVPAAKLRHHLKGMQSAVSRGERLTRQLLAFSRQGALHREVLELDAVVRDFVPFLERSLGETIRVVLELGSAACRVKFDRAEFEAALLNLAINARDAMPSGGTLTIRTERQAIPEHRSRGSFVLASGDYLLVSVIDTGSGMAPSVIEKVFEPFFTTKEVGKGTGLGLAQVWGFAKQSGGHVEIESAVGRGTAVKLYVPRSDEVPRGDDNRSSGDEPGGSETILVVEDDDNVRNIVVETLAELGYRLVVASDGPEALAALQREPRIDLLFTDQVMPNGISGLELAHQARAMRPDLRVLLCSGYAKRVANSNEERFPLIAKPYRRADLARKLRAVLAGTTDPA